MKCDSMIWGAVVMEVFVTWFLWCTGSKLCNADRSVSRTLQVKETLEHYLHKDSETFSGL